MQTSRRDTTLSALRTSVLAGVTMCLGVCIGSCSERQASQDFTEVMEAICDDYCRMNVACHDPPIFETHAECDEVCMTFTIMLDDSVCGEVYRTMYGCVGQTQTCEAYNDTNNVHAETYTCQTEKMALHTVDCTDVGDPP